MAGGRPYPEWRLGWDEDRGVLCTLCYELQRLAAELEDTPREHDAVLLLVGEGRASLCVDALKLLHCSVSVHNA